MKQTAVEWLVNEIPNIDWENSYWQNKIEQAKEMEKQEKLKTQIAENESVLEMFRLHGNDSRQIITDKN